MERFATKRWRFMGTIVVLIFIAIWTQATKKPVIEFANPELFTII